MQNKTKQKNKSSVAQDLFLRPYRNFLSFLQRIEKRDHGEEAPPTALSPNHKACSSHVGHCCHCSQSRSLSLDIRQGMWLKAHGRAGLLKLFSEKTETRFTTLGHPSPSLQLVPICAWSLLDEQTSQSQAQCPVQSPDSSSLPA